MIKFLRQKYVWACLVLLEVPFFVNAVGGGPTGGFSINIKNPLSVSSIEELLDLVLNLIITIGIPIITLTIMWSGFLFIKAQGKPGDIEEAKKNIMYVLFGTAIVLGVFSILAVIQATIRAIGA